MVFLDTGFFVGSANRSDNWHLHSKQIMAEILNGRHGKPLTCDYVLDEVVTNVWKRTKNVRIAGEIGREIISAGHWTMKFVPPECVRACVESVNKYRDMPMSFTDWVVTWMAGEYGHSTIVTTDEILSKYASKWNLKSVLLMENGEYEKHQRAVMEG